MSARILIVDSVATNRIVLNVKLIAARYLVDGVASVEDARAVIAETPPDLIIMAASFNDGDGADFCQWVRAQQDLSDIPIVMVGDYAASNRRLAALGAGADDVMTRPLHDQVLLARIRSLLRARAAAAELRLRDDTHHALGLAEPAAQFNHKGRIAVIGASGDSARQRAAMLCRLTGHGCGATAFESSPGHGVFLSEARADAIVIDGTEIAPVRLAEIMPRLVSELRSRTETHSVGQIAILPAGADDTAAILLDIGVDDVVEAPISEQELALRVNAVLRRGLQREHLRQSLRDGLKAAVTDPLTGLYNRRYARPHLVKLAERSRATGTDFAMMVLDIDHFKAINDAYGHAAGDRVLVDVANRLKACVRGQDLVARIGGEEFLVAMPETDCAAARTAAERLREAICGRPFETGREEAKSLSVTLSIGVAMASETALAEEDEDLGPCLDGLFDRADAALYRAKCAGRNAVDMGLSAA